MNDYRSPLSPGLPLEAPPSRVYTSGAWDDALTAAVAHHAARICEEQANRFTDDRARYAAHECAAAIRANSTALGEMTQVPVRTFGRMLDRIAELEKESARLNGTLDALREMVDQGTVFLSAWVVFDDVRSYRVTARGRDGWRKTADAKSLEDAIREAHATDWSPAINLDIGEQS